MSRKAKKKPKKKEIWCHYRQGWVPMGRSRKRCPVCGAVLKPKSDIGHKIRTK
jgi:hypothetical protein